ncbi:MAG: hypothetical protein IIV93_08020 [Clostridia bacterium]|nr:hypothetical protein [Clostridia bacterium]
MATTGFWPVKGHLRDVLVYADNPDKTTDPAYVDEDLRQALQYARVRMEAQEREKACVSLQGGLRHEADPDGTGRQGSKGLSG